MSKKLSANDFNERRGHICVGVDSDVVFAEKKNQAIQGLNQPVVALLLAAFFAYSLLSGLIGSPVFGSDEYAYFISGMYLERLGELYELDPGLQQLSNLLYFKLINAWTSLFGYDFSDSYRTLHIAEYIAAATIIYQTFKHEIDRSSAFWSVLAFLLLPNTIYIYAVMPETELVLLVACLGYVLIVIFQRQQNVAAALAGFLIGMALLFKPHAVALLAASIITVSMAPLLGIVKGGRVTAIRMIFVLLGTCYISFVLLWRMSSQKWTFDPSLALGLKFYGKYLQTDLPSISISTKLLMVFHYAAAHAVVMVLIFAPVIVWSALHLVSMIKSISGPTKEQTPNLSVAALFLLAMMFMHIAMIAWFTVGVASLDETEAMRLHGRYLGPVISFFPFLYFHGVRNLDSLGEKLVGLVVAVSLLASVLFLFGVFKIYPWDYPLLFAFFDSNNNYGWSYDYAHSIGIFLLVLMVATWLVVLFKRAMLKTVLFFQIFIIFFAGCVQTYNWAIIHTKVNGPLVQYSRAISTIAGGGAFGKGVLVSNERYGRTSYILFGLANAPRVLMKNPGASVSQDEVGDADWVLFSGSYNAKFEYLDSVVSQPFNFFPLKTNVSLERRVTPDLLIGNPLSVSLSAGHYAPARLKGFNLQEEWGAWTDTEKSEILLPVMLHGIVNLKLDGWAISENLKEPLVVRVGGGLCKLQLSNIRNEYECTLNIERPSDRILLESSVYRPVNSHRNMGVAIARVSVELLHQQ